MNSNITLRLKSDWTYNTGILLIIVGLFSKYLECENLSMYILTLLFLCLIFMNNSFRRTLQQNGVGLYFGGTILYVYTLFNVLFTNETRYLESNLRYLFCIFCVLLIIFVLTLNSKGILSGILQNSFVLINVFGLINQIVLTLQLNIYGFMMKDSWLVINSYYADLCSGLFGLNGTHEMTYFFCFLVLYNYYYSKYIVKERKIKIILAFYNLLLIIWMSFLSTQNDNLSFAFIFTLMLGTYFIMSSIWERKKFPIKIIKYSILTICVLVIILSIPSVNAFINEILLERLNLMFLGLNSSNALGSNERLGIVSYALEREFGWSFGIGLGSNRWVANAGESVMGFTHFGLNSISAFVVLGGLPFYILYVCFYSWIIWKMDKQKKDYLFLVIVVLQVVIASFYTIIFVSFVSSIWFCLSMSLFALAKHEIISNKNKTMNNLRVRQI